MKALILAAGSGTRLKYLTANRPKPMLPLSGSPLLEYLILWLRQHGVNEIGINLHYLPERITQHFGDGSKFDVSIHYSIEERLLGTAGAAKRLQSFLDGPFVVVYGDVFTNLDLTRLIEFHTYQRDHNPAPPLMTLSLYPVPDPQERSVVTLEEHGEITNFVEKPQAHVASSNLAFSGIALCEPEILEMIPPDLPYDFGYDLIPSLLTGCQPLFGQSIQDGEFVIDIGSVAGYLKALTSHAQRAKEDVALAPTLSAAAR